MRIDVVEYINKNSGRRSYACYGDCNELIGKITNRTYDLYLQKRLFGGWNSDYQKICDRANKIFKDRNEVPYYSFVGEYDSENPSEVCKVEYHKKSDKSAEITIYLGSGDSDAIVLTLNGREVDLDSVHSKDGKRVQEDKAKLAKVYRLVDFLGVTGGVGTDDAMFYYVLSLGCCLIERL